MIFTLIGQVVAWCITNQENQIHMQVFLQSIKERLSKIDIKTVMTDDGKTLYNLIH